MKNKKDRYTEVKEFIESKGNKLISKEYKNNKGKLKIQCKCGEIFKRTFGDFKNKNMYYCTCCSGNKLRYSDVKKFIESKNCKLISKEYENNSTKLDIQCSCGEIFKVSFNTFKKDEQWQCKSCGEKKRIKSMQDRVDGFKYYTYEDVKSIIESKTDLVLLSEEYNGCFDELKLKCSCGEIFYKPFNTIIYNINFGKRNLCPKCIKKGNDEEFRLKEKDIQKSIFNFYKKEKFILLNYDEYKNNRTLLKFKCSECGEVFTSTVHALTTGDGRLCPNCDPPYSKGEMVIKNFLDNNNIEYIQEKTFKECRYYNPLRFDFYLPNYNCCIEYDGEQHYKEINFFGGERGYEERKRNDSIKNKYCKENNISLLRIPYFNFNNIDNILNAFLDKLTPR